MTKCEFCGKELKNPGPLRKFCRNRCRQKAYYKRLESNTINEIGQIVKPIRFNLMNHCHNSECRFDNSNNELWFDAFIRKGIKPKLQIDIELEMKVKLIEPVPKDYRVKFKERYNVDPILWRDLYKVVYCRRCLTEHYALKIVPIVNI